MCHKMFRVEAKRGQSADRKHTYIFYLIINPLNTLICIMFTMIYLFDGVCNFLHIDIFGLL